MPPLRVSRAQMLAYRRRVGALDERLPWGRAALRRVAHAGLADSMPRAALLSIHARVEGAGPAAWEDPAIKSSFVSALAVAGLSGTLKDRLRTPPARGVVLAKTGTTSIASALSGYVRQRYVFSVLDNGNPVSSWWARRAQDRFATVLAAQ